MFSEECFSLVNINITKELLKKQIVSWIFSIKIWKIIPIYVKLYFTNTQEFEKTLLIFLKKKLLAWTDINSSYFET
jgi:hypothetical protein